jgi:hypothetical protein
MIHLCWLSWWSLYHVYQAIYFADNLPVQTFISEPEKDNRVVSTTEYIENLQQILNYTHSYARKHLKECNEYQKKHNDT